MLSFIEAKGRDKEALELLLAKYCPLVSSVYGQLPVQQGTINHLTFAAPTLAELFQTHIVARRSEGLLNVGVRSPLAGDLLALPRFTNAATTMTLMLGAFRQRTLELSEQQAEVSLDVLENEAFWAIAAAQLHHNLAYILQRNQGGIYIPIPPEQMVGMSHRQHIPLADFEARRSRILLNAKNQMTAAEVLLGHLKAEDHPELFAYQARVAREHYASLVALREPSYIRAKQLKDWVEVRNGKSETLELTSCHKVIFNPDASATLTMDHDAFRMLLTTIHEVYSGLRKRRQITYFINYADAGESHALDVSLYQGGLRIVYVDPANQISQHSILSILKQWLTELGIEHQILACAADLFPAQENNNLYGYAIAGQLSNVSFDKLKAKATLEQPTFKDSLWPERLGSSEEKIPGVQWFPVTALGYKTVIMGRDKAQALSRLEVLYPGKSESHLKSLSKWYDLDYESVPARTYIDSRRERLAARIQGSAFEGLSLAVIRQRLGLEAGEPDAKAMRMLGNGQGPRMYLEYLLEIHPSLMNEQSPTSGKTALHFALENAPARAALLLSKGAKTDLPNAQGQTVADLAKDKQSEELSGLFSKLSCGQ